MQMMSLLFCIFLMLAGIPTNPSGQDTEISDYLEALMVDTEFLIIKSTRDYEEAKKFVSEASQKLGIKIDLRDMEPHPETGLTVPREQCAPGHIWNPFYYWRGRGNNGVYLSIEWSNGYEGFNPGYYIVVAASAIKEEGNGLAELLAKVRKFYPEAYLKGTRVYHGCIH